MKNSNLQGLLLRTRSVVSFDLTLMHTMKPRFHMVKIYQIHQIPRRRQPRVLFNLRLGMLEPKWKIRSNQYLVQVSYNFSERLPSSERRDSLFHEKLLSDLKVLTTSETKVADNPPTSVVEKSAPVLREVPAENPQNVITVSCDFTFWWALKQKKIIDLFYSHLELATFDPRLLSLQINAQNNYLFIPKLRDTYQK